MAQRRRNYRAYLMATASLDELNGGNSLGALVWQSGRIVRQWEAVVSPLDGEVYRRKTATGSGATDPSIDTTNYRAASYNRVTSQANQWAGGAPTVTTNNTKASGTTLSTVPGFTAGERKLVLSLTGRGALLFAMLRWSASGAPASVLRTELVVDDRTIFDANQSLGSANSAYWCPVGTVIAITGADPRTALPNRVEFRKSAALYVTSNVAQGLGQVLFETMYEGYES